MASKSPLHQLQDTIVGAVKGAITHPVGTAEKAVEQAKGTISLGRAVAGQVAKEAAGAVTSRLHGRQGHAPTVPHPRTSESAGTATTDRAPLKKAPAKKAPAKKAPAKQPVRPPVTDVATELVKEQAAHQPVPKQPPAPESPIDAAADAVHVDATPADVAKKVAKKAPAKKAAARKAPAKKAATKSAPTKSTPSAKLPPRKAPATPATPKTAAELLEDTSVETPVGTTGADVGTNPDTTETDLQQPGTEPIVDPATVKAVASEAAVGARAADTDKG